MLNNPIKFPSSPSSNENELPSHHSSEENVSSDDRMSDYSPPWTSEKEDPEEEDEDDATADAEDDSDSNFASPPPKPARRAWSSLWEDHLFTLSSL